MTLYLIYAIAFALTVRAAAADDARITLMSDAGALGYERGMLTHVGNEKHVVTRVDGHVIHVTQVWWFDWPLVTCFAIWCRARRR